MPFVHASGCKKGSKEHCLWILSLLRVLLLTGAVLAFRLHIFRPRHHGWSRLVTVTGRDQTVTSRDQKKRPKGKVLRAPRDRP